MDTVSKDETEGFARHLAGEIEKQVARAVIEVLARPETRRALAQALGARVEGPVRRKKTGASASAAAEGKPVCAEPGCNRPARARGLCSKHYQRLRYREKRSAEGEGAGSGGGLRRGVGVCNVEGCEEQVYAREMCSKHFMEWVRARRKG